MKLTHWLDPVRAYRDRLTSIDVWPTLVALWHRFLHDRLGLTASALTYATVLALVPFVAVILSVLTAFPAFDEIEGSLQHWLVQSLIPQGIADNVMDYLAQFANQARSLGWISFVALMATVVIHLLTIDKTLNQIWRVDRKRTLSQRVLVYWAALTLGPLLLITSLAITSTLLAPSRAWLPALPASEWALGVLRFLLMAVGFTLLYRFVPNTPVRWQHAASGGLFASLALGVVRHGLGIYLTTVPTYSLIYGAFAIVPILLLWIYLGWSIVLLGAMVAAYLPSLMAHAQRYGGTPGWDFRLAVETVRALVQARAGEARGLTRDQLAADLRVDPMDLSAPLAALHALNWVGELDTRGENEPTFQVLLVQPETTAMLPLMEKLLLDRPQALGSQWQDKPLAALTLADVTSA